MGNPFIKIDPYGLTEYGPLTESMRDMYNTYQDMKDAETKGADKYFHCLANCRASSRGPVGRVVAKTISSTRETVQNEPQADRQGDEAANRQGQGDSMMCPASDCYDRCKSLIPPHGIPQRHLPTYADPKHIYTPR